MLPWRIKLIIAADLIVLCPQRLGSMRGFRCELIGLNCCRLCLLVLALLPNET
jgi:hypothetical protein